MSNPRIEVTPKESARFRRLYDGGRSILQIAEAHGRSMDTVHRWLMKTGGTRTSEAGRVLALEEGRALNPPHSRKFSLSERAFETLTPETAWCLGLLYGDGNVRPTGRIMLACGPDKDIGEKFSAILESNRPVYLHGSTEKCWIVEVFSQLMVRQLSRHGIYPAKTYTIKFPSLPMDLLPHFVRGLWESDGCSSVSRERLCMNYTSASECFVNTLAVVIGMLTGVCANIGTRPPRAGRSFDNGRTAYVVDYHGGPGERVAAWMYNPSTPATRCDRKWRIVEAFL